MSKKSIQSSGDIFQDLGYSPTEAEKLTIKAQLMVEIKKYIEKHKLTQEEAAERMGVTRPRISDVNRGKLDRFTIDALVDMLARVGKHCTMKVKNAA